MSQEKDWIEATANGHKYFFRYIVDADKSQNKATLDCTVDFHVSIMKDNDIVVLDPTDFKVQVKQAMLPVIQDLLQRIVEGERVECVAPKELAYGEEHPVDIYLELELKKITYYTGISFITPAEDAQ